MSTCSTKVISEFVYVLCTCVPNMFSEVVYVLCTCATKMVSAFVYVLNFLLKHFTHSRSYMMYVCYVS